MWWNECHTRMLYIGLQKNRGRRTLLWSSRSLTLTVGIFAVLPTTACFLKYVKGSVCKSTDLKVISGDV